MSFKVPVFFDNKMVCRRNDSFSPSAGKPLAVVEDWKRLFGEQIVIKQFSPVTQAELSLAHDAKFVSDVLDCFESNGFGNRLPEVAATLPFTSGAMLEAACEAVRNGLVAVAPVSGFHHACYDSAGGFCTFNGLMVAAQWLLTFDSRVDTVGILDLDHHDGNGTRDIIRTLKLEDKVVHFTAGGKRGAAWQFLQKLPAMIEALYTDCDVLLYRAGADPHIDDPLGGWMTTEELRQRDAIVFAACATMKLPVAWNLAGGYQDPLKKVLEIHNNTMASCVATYGRVQ